MKIRIISMFTILFLTIFSTQSMGWWWDDDSDDSVISTEAEASETTESLWDSVLDKAKEITDKTVEKTDELSSKVIEETRKLTEGTKELVSDKLKISSEKLQRYKEIMKEAGFNYAGLTANIGLLPGPDFYFIRKNRLTKEQETVLLDKYKDEMIPTFLLKAIFNAPETMYLPDHIVEEVTITFIAIPPKLSITMIPIENSGIEKTGDHPMYFRNK
ncbi:hypothetical protein QUF50_06500 [Thiotrichales bacterium HSG1]|nr:hypothetical protein [Thiotrichales bacterium HSG1]